MFFVLVICKSIDIYWYYLVILINTEYCFYEIHYIPLFYNSLPMKNKIKKVSPGRPKTRLHNPVRTAAKQTKEGEEKYIIIAKTDSISMMKDVAYWDRLTIKEVYEEAIQDRIKKYEKKSGKLKKRPE